MQCQETRSVNRISHARLPEDQADKRLVNKSLLYFRIHQEAYIVSNYNIFSFGSEILKEIRQKRGFD